MNAPLPTHTPRTDRRFKAKGTNADNAVSGGYTNKVRGVINITDDLRQALRRIEMWMAPDGAYRIEVPDIKVVPKVLRDLLREGEVVVSYYHQPTGTYGRMRYRLPRVTRWRGVFRAAMKSNSTPSFLNDPRG